MSLTKAQLKEVLDAIYNNGDPDTEYITTGNISAVKSYYNQKVVEQADILKRQDENNEYIISILQTESHPYVEDSEVKHYTCKDMKDAVLTSVTDLKEYNRGLVSYIPMSSYIRNICMFIGVKLSDDFESVNPVFYNDLVEIVQKYCTLSNNGLTYWGRYDESNTPKYRSYVPVNCILDTVLYFKDMGVFATEGTDPSCLLAGWKDSSNSKSNFSDYKKIGKDAFIKKIQGTEGYDNKPGYSSQQFIYNHIEEIFSAMTDVNWGNALFFRRIEMSSNYCRVFIKEFPNNIKVSSFQLPGAESLSCYGDDDFNIINHEVYYSVQTDPVTITYTKTVTSYQGEQDNTISIGGYSRIVSNIASIFIVPYSRNPLYNTNIYFPEVHTPLTTAAEPNPYLIPINYMVNCGYSKRWGQVTTLYRRLWQQGVEFSDNDFVVAFSETSANTSNINLYIVRNCKNLVVPANTGDVIHNNHTYTSNLYGTYSGNDNNYRYFFNDAFADRIFYSGNYQFTQTTLEKYVIRRDSSGNISDITLDSTTQATSFPMAGYYVITHNLGEIRVVEEKGTLNGIELISGAVLPSNVSNIANFITTYSQAKYRGISNPYFTDEELIITNLHTETWVSCSTTKDTPLTQSGAWLPEIDGLTDAEIQDVVKEIQNATDGNDTNPDPLSENEIMEGENEGSNTLPDNNSVFHYSMQEFIAQWVLNDENFVEFGNAVNNRDFITSLVDIIADPLKAIISCQIAPTFLVPDTTTHLGGLDVYIRGRQVRYKKEIEGVETWVEVKGQRLVDNVRYFELGEIDIDETFDSYEDLVGTNMTLFLPFIGNIELDIRDFYKGKLKLTGFAESYTGQLIYYVTAIKDDQERIITTLTGNCYSSIPLTQDNYATFLNAFTRG